MKKIPFYNPASPLFFHIAVVALWIPIVLYGFYQIWIAFSFLFFSVLYPLLTLAMAFIVRRAYINTFQIPVPEEFVDKLLHYNRYLISVIYILSTILVFVQMMMVPPDADLGPLPLYLIFLLAISWACFPFHFHIPPAIIRFILLKKARIELNVFISAILLLLYISLIIFILYILIALFFY